MTGSGTVASVVDGDGVASVVVVARAVIGVKVVGGAGDAEAPTAQAPRSSANDAQLIARRNRIQCIETTVPFRHRKTVVHERRAAERYRAVFGGRREGAHNEQVGLSVR